MQACHVFKGDIIIIMPKQMQLKDGSGSVSKSVGCLFGLKVFYETGRISVVHRGTWA